MKQWDDEGRLLFTNKGGIRKKRFKDEALTEGMPAQALWDDIRPVNSQAAERVDYPTQKPLALLERIISASTNPTREDGTPMVVADFFGGSGTTAAAAHRLGRHFITCDVGINSLQTARDRLREAGAAFAVKEVRDGVALFRDPAQTMQRLGELIPASRAAACPPPGAGPFRTPGSARSPSYFRTCSTRTPVYSTRRASTGSSTRRCPRSTRPPGRPWCTTWT